MNLLHPFEIKSLLEKYHAKPSKRLGQNFLIDNRVLNRVITTASLTKGDTILEVGPGIGTLTQALSSHAGKVIAIEKDRAMLAILQETLQGSSNVTVIEGDILHYQGGSLSTPYKVVANIPYYLTSVLIRKLLEEPPGGQQPASITLMVQKEVAQRMCVNPPNMNLLAVSVQFYAKARIVAYVKKGCFWPVPEVDSAIVHIIPNRQAPPVSPTSFFAVVKAGFSHPRKQLVNNLATVNLPNGVPLDKYKTVAWLQKHHISPSQRAQTLTLDNWIALANSIKHFN